MKRLRIHIFIATLILLLAITCFSIYIDHFQPTAAIELNSHT
ncbi:hypothetical protein [Alkaliphilus crotonatoxidans]